VPLALVETHDVFLGATAGALSPDGRHLYVTTKDAIVMAERDAATGSLRFAQFILQFRPGQESLWAGRDVAVSPDGLHVYTASDLADALAILRRDPATGRMSFVADVRAQDEPDLLGVWRVVVSRDGTTVYAGGNAGRLVVFRRDPGTDALDRVQSVSVCPVGRIECRVRSIAVSPDDRHVYAVGEDHAYAGAADDVVAVFSRDLEGGTLSSVQEVRDGLGGHVDLPDLQSVVVSPDGRHVYVGGRDHETDIVSFSRDLESGALTVLQVVPSGGGARLTDCLAISPDGSTLYGAGDAGYLFSVFHRDSATGMVHLAGDLQDGFDVYSPLFSINGAVVGSESRYVYTVGFRGIINVFRKTCGDGHLDSGEGCDDANTVDGDGCDSSCTVERCFGCAGVPSVCEPSDREPCDDGDDCTRDSTCAVGECAGGVPEAEGQACDDEDACTAGDACAAGQCTSGAPVACGACEACDRTFGCVGVLASGCRESPGFRGPAGPMNLRDRRRGDWTVQWEWVGRVASSEIMGPETTGDYEFCVFDAPFLGSGSRRRRLVSGARILADVECGPRSCWRRRRDGGLHFRSSDSADLGVRSLTFKPAGKRESAIQIKGRSASLMTDSLPLADLVTTQLRTEAGACWESHFRLFVETNNARVFRGRAGLKKCRKFPSCD
jgi:cysteine-rich repeat protein